MRTCQRRAAFVLGAMLVCMPGAMPAQAQGDEELEVVEVKEVDNKPVLWSMLTMGLLIAMAVGANAIPSKRGHQD